MPIVPVIAQTAMQPTPNTAPAITPVRNFAPQQQEAIGQATQQAGELAMKTGATVGDRLAEQVDDARVKAAEAAALGQVQIINYDPKTGFLNQKGQNAIDQYEPAKQAVSKAFQDQLDDLSNPIQKYMFQQVKQHHLLAIGQTMGEHAFRATSDYAGEAAVSRANSYATRASNAYSSYGQHDGDGNVTGDFAKNMATAEQETLTAVGVMKGAPADSDIAKEALLNLHTQIGAGAVMQMMDARAPYSKVQQMYDDMKSKGMLTLQAENTLGKMVKTYSEQENVRANSTLYLSDAVRASQGQPTSTTGTPDYQFAVKGATITASAYDPDQGSVTLNVTKGSNIQAPADGKVLQVGKNEDGNFSLQIQHPDGSVTTFSGLSASNVKVGDQVQRGEDVATSGQLEGSTKQAVLWSLADKNGNAVDPTKAGLGPVDITKITDEKQLSDALGRMRKQVTDPYLQQQTASEMESIVRRNQQMANAQASQNYKDANDQYFKGGQHWRAISPTLFNSLPGDQQQHFKDAEIENVLKNYHQGQAFKEMSETGVVSYFYQNPDMLTPDNVDLASPKLANSTYLSLMNRATTLQNDPKGVVNAQAVQERIKYYADLAGVNMQPKTEADKQTYNALQHKIQTDIDQIKTDNHGKATADQVEKIIQQELIKQKVSYLPHSAWNPLVAAKILPNQEATKFNFQLPAGATHVAPGSDGKLHYLDANNKDLGVTQ